MRIPMIVVMFFHGFAHLVGFAAAWELSAEVPRKTTILAQRFDIGVAGTRMLGAGWLLLALGFTAAATAAILHHPWWPMLAIGVSAMSLVMCLLALPEAKFGAIVNIGLITALVIGRHAGML